MGGLGVAAVAVGCNVLLGIEDVPVPVDATAPDSGAAGADSSAAEDTPVEATAGDAPGDANAPDAGDASDNADGAMPTSASDAGNAGDATGSCGDTTSNGHHCGRCGHDCLGGTCAASLCQPIPLVTAALRATPTLLAQDDAFLYWTDDNHNRVYRTDKNLGGAVVVTQSTFIPYPIVADDGGIYWGDAVGIWLCPKAGCAAGPVGVAQTARYLPTGLAVDDGNVYWTEESSNTVLFAPKDGLDASPSILWQNDASIIVWGPDASADFVTRHVAADGQHVYFTASDGRLRAVGVDGGAPASAGSPNRQGSFGVALDATHVYWSVRDPGAGLIGRATTPALADAGAVASGLQSPTSIATDGTNLYWVGASAVGGAGLDIYACSIAACQPTRLAGGYAAFAVVVDSKAVYWTDHGTTATNGALWKLAK